MYCTCSSISLHSKLYMFSLFILIIVNIMFYLFYLQVEPVYLRVSNKCYPNHFLRHQYRQHTLKICPYLINIIDRNVPMYLIKILCYWYQHQLMSVRCGCFISNVFSVTNSVRQGGILSPKLFYIHLHRWSE